MTSAYRCFHCDQLVPAGEPHSHAIDSAAADIADDAGLHPDDAWEIASKIVEMAERVKVANKVVPGAQASWGVEIEGVVYRVVVSVADPNADEATG